MQDDELQLDAPTSQPAGEELRLGALGEGVEKVRDSANDLVAGLPTILLGVGVLVAFIILGWLVKFGVQKLSPRFKGWDRWNLVVAVSRLAQGAVILLGVLVAAVIIFPGFTPSKVFSLLGFGSVAIGFAFRDVLQNYLAGILLLLTQPFRIGDEITFGDFEGRVMDIQTRATFIRTYDGRRVVIPNAELFTNSVLVNTAFEQRRVEYDIGIGYGDNIETAKQILLDVMDQDETANKSPAPQVLVVELGGEAVMLRARWWIDPPQKRDLFESRDGILGEAKRRLTAAGIDLPFPTQQILFHDQTDEADGDRRRQREGWPATPDAEDPPPRKLRRGEQP